MEYLPTTNESNQPSNKVIGVVRKIRIVPNELTSCTGC